MKYKFVLYFFAHCTLATSNHTAWNGEKYDKNSSGQYKIGIEAVESFNLQGTEKVLDIGCGNGKVTAFCADHLTSGSLTAIDSSPSMIEFASTQYGSNKNIQFLLQDVTKMTFDEEFDLVYSIFCLHWVKDQETAIKNIARSLKRGGKAVLYISMPNRSNGAFKTEFDALMTSSLWRSYSDTLRFNYYPMTKELLLHYAQQNNLSASFNTIHDVEVYDSYQKFKHRITAYGLGHEILQVLGQELGNQFVDCYLEKVYNALGLTIDQPFTWEHDAFILTLTK